MAFSQTQLDSLETAIAKGVLTVRLNGRLVTYHSLDEMIRLRNAIRSELGISSPAFSRGRILTLATGKGL